MTLIAIDPGPTESAYVVYDGQRVILHNHIDNEAMRRFVPSVDVDALAIEGIACYGMPVGRETFDACIWIGRFIETWVSNYCLPWELVYRSEVKSHLCRSMKAKDANVRQALLDRFGPGKKLAQGTKAKPGPLYGISEHKWAALAVAVTYHDTRILKRETA